MNSFIITYDQTGKYSAIIYSISYLNPIEDIEKISKELRRNIKKGNYVLFDLLLSNGDNFNRFAEWRYDSDDLNTSNIIVTDISPEQLHSINLHYSGRIADLSRSVLTKKEQYKYATMK